MKSCGMCLCSVMVASLAITVDDLRHPIAGLYIPPDVLQWIFTIYKSVFIGSSVFSWWHFCVGNVLWLVNFVFISRIAGGYFRPAYWDSSVEDFLNHTITVTESGDADMILKCPTFLDNNGVNGLFARRVNWAIWASPLSMNFYCLGQTWRTHQGILSNFRLFWVWKSRVFCIHLHMEDIELAEEHTVERLQLPGVSHVISYLAGGICRCSTGGLNRQHETKGCLARRSIYLDIVRVW